MRPLSPRGAALARGRVIRPDGRTFVLAELMADRITEFDISADGALSNRRALTVERGSDAQADLTLAAPVAIAGRIVGDEERPLAGSPSSFPLKSVEVETLMLVVLVGAPSGVTVVSVLSAIDVSG